MGAYTSTDREAERVGGRQAHTWTLHIGPLRFFVFTAKIFIQLTGPHVDSARWQLIKNTGPNVVNKTKLIVDIKVTGTLVKISCPNIQGLWASCSDAKGPHRREVVRHVHLIPGGCLPSPQRILRSRCGDGRLSLGSLLWWVLRVSKLAVRVPSEIISSPVAETHLGKSAAPPIGVPNTMSGGQQVQSKL